MGGKKTTTAWLFLLMRPIWRRGVSVLRAPSCVMIDDTDRKGQQQTGRERNNHALMGIVTRQDTFTLIMGSNNVLGVSLWVSTTTTKDAQMMMRVSNATVKLRVSTSRKQERNQKKAKRRTRLLSSHNGNAMFHQECKCLKSM